MRAMFITGPPTHSVGATRSALPGNNGSLFSKRQRITLRLLYAIAIPSVVCLSSVVCDVGAPYSAG